MSNAVGGDTGEIFLAKLLISYGLAPLLARGSCRQQRPKDRRGLSRDVESKSGVRRIGLWGRSRVWPVDFGLQCRPPRSVRIEKEEGKPGPTYHLDSYSNSSMSGPQNTVSILPRPLVLTHLGAPCLGSAVHDSNNVMVKEDRNCLFAGLA